MRRAAAYVEDYFARAQRIVADETVVVENLARDFTPLEGTTQHFRYALRVEWTPAAAGPPDAQFTRELLSVNGRRPRQGDEPHCAAPRPITPEPLAMLLSTQQGDYIFSSAGRDRVDGRMVARVDYRVKSPGPDITEWDRDCISFDSPSRLRGRLWIDEESGAVQRIEETSVGPVELRPDRNGRRESPGVTFDRWTLSIRYKPVTFTDPEETILLPSEIEALTMTRTRGTRRRQTYSNYRRFVTDGRVLP